MSDDVLIGLRLDAATHRKIRAMAAREDRSVAGQVRHMVRQLAATYWVPEGQDELDRIRQAGERVVS